MPVRRHEVEESQAPELRRLLDRLALDHLGDDVFRDSGTPQELPRLFGGQVAAQALAALGATVAASRPVHSLHVYFVGLGHPNRRLDFHVSRVKEGRSFDIRQVEVIQDERTLLTATASFQAPEPGPVHGRERDSGTIDPTHLPRWEDRLAGYEDRLTVLWRRSRPIDLRYIDVPPQIDPQLSTRPLDRLRTMWRADGPLPDEPLLHACVAVYACDMTLLETALLPHGTVFADGRFHAASLDHTMWFHTSVIADRWVLHEQEAIATSGARGLAMSRMYDPKGRLVISSAQEGLLRPAGHESATVGMPPVS